jgi:hypothetical protein
VSARYDGRLKDPVTGKERKLRFKTLHKLLGLVTYLEWVMILVTTLTTISMMFERPDSRVMEKPILQVGKRIQPNLMSKLMFLLKGQCVGTLHKFSALTKFHFAYSDHRLRIRDRHGQRADAQGVGGRALLHSQR